MNLTARFNLLFNKNECIKVIITDINKRVKTHIIRIKNDKSFNINKRTFVINYDAVFYSKGIPTYFYYIDNPVAIKSDELKKSLEPLDTNIASKLIPISSSDLHTAMEETISEKIIRYSEGGDKKIINTILLMGGINILATLGGSYFLFMNIEKILNFLIENEPMIKAIRDFLVNSSGQ